MLEINANQVTPPLRALFRADEPQAPRCFAVLDGIANRGRILCDSPDNPVWAVVQEQFDGAIYWGGDIPVTTLLTIIEILRIDGEVLVGLWPEDPRLDLLPPDPDYDGRTLEFYERPIGKGLEKQLNQLPGGYELRRLDRHLIMQTEWGPNDVQHVGGLENWERSCLGYCLMHRGEILCEATVGPPALGLYEPGVFTHEAYRGKGYATLTAARLIQEIEALGGQTYWNCAKQNVASAAVARKLGYQVEKEYRCMAWNKTG
jgi:RimJ/RimL family protein N-acetyltransferase